jgi:hypothetical protein
MYDKQSKQGEAPLSQDPVFTVAEIKQQLADLHKVSDASHHTLLSVQQRIAFFNSASHGVSCIRLCSACYVANPTGASVCTGSTVSAIEQRNSYSRRCVV